MSDKPPLSFPCENFARSPGVEEHVDQLVSGLRAFNRDRYGTPIKTDCDANGAIPCDTCSGFRAPDEPCWGCKSLVEDGRKYRKGEPNW